jgi:hypothetical protein
MSAIVATAHGHAILMFDGMFGSGHHAAQTAAEQAAAATLALISRDLNRPGESGDLSGNPGAIQSPNC